ncbi:MAG: chromosome segregation protein SMC [Clostridia bacterium]
MKLTKLEAYGFKSFADKLEINFNEAITAIVGPNGCGKSNVSDAIRWILGEQSCRQLRGKNMQDLIFGGTEKRKSMSYCEASLFFDNTTRIFPLEFDEVVISRKLYKSGESEYFLNRRNSTLREISDLLRDCGLGRDGYAVVGQGRMDAILNAKPEDRRSIFEEALGISKFRVRKNETERKIARTHANMDRIRDILSVLSKRIEPLLKQSNDAKEYLTLKDELKYHEINGYIYNYDNSNDQKEKYLKKIDAITEELKYNEQQYENASERYEILINKIAQTDSEIAKNNGKATEIKVQIERRIGEHNVLIERINAFEKIINGLNNDIANAEKSIKTSNERIESIALEKSVKYEAEKLSIKEIDEMIKRLNVINEKINTQKDKIDQENSDVMQLMDDITENKSKIATLLSEKQSVNERLKVLEEEENTLSQKLNSLGGDERQLLLDYNEAERKSKILESSLWENEEEFKKLNERYIELSKQIAEYNEQYLRIKTNRDMLKGISERYEGFNQTVKLLMKDCVENSKLQRCILGVVGNVIKVQSDYETAIETVLGGALQNIITKTEEDAAEVIEYLKKNKYGRLTFLPISSVKTHWFEEKNALNEKGALGIAAKLITYDEKFQPVISNLLGGTLVADTMENAVKIARKYRYAFRIVTLEGEILTPQGSMSGGSNRTKEYNILSTDRQIAESEQKMAEISKISTTLKSEYLDTIEKRNNSMIKKEEDNKQLSFFAVTIAKYKEKIYSNSAYSENEKSSVVKLKAEKAEKELRAKYIEAEYAKAKENNDNLLILQEKTNKGASIEEKLLMELSTQKDSIIAAISENKQKSALLHSQIENINSEIERLNINNEETKKLCDYKKDMLQMDKEACEAIERELYYDSDDKMSNELTALEQVVNIKMELKQQLSGEFAYIDKERATINNEVMRLNQLKSRELFNAERIDADLESMRAKIEEDYDLTYSAALRFKDNAYNMSGNKKEINRLRLCITKLGNVNVNAIEEYKEVKEEYESDCKQMEDLEKAESDLEKIIAELTIEIVNRFNVGFATINSNFAEVFKELFNGGKANMIIERVDDKEELDYGIEIEAQPPGKKLQNISLLSGGERALTCIAILFAILKLKPMPFCVLDEIEAPLDDANAERVANYLHKYSTDTQFIIITHKKPTMECANELFGVTMQEKGVSKIVSVQLTEKSITALHNNC